jgi:transcriptional regulator with XRE-family HTH domain
LVARAVERTGSQSDLARLLEVDRVSVWRWTHGRSLPKSPRLRRLLAELAK